MVYGGDCETLSYFHSTLLYSTELYLMKTLPSLALGILLASGMSSASAAVAFTDVSTGTQTYGGGLNITFKTGSQSLSVTALGAFDLGGNGFSAGTFIPVTIYPVTSFAVGPGGSDYFPTALGTALASTTLDASNTNNTGVNGFVFKAITPITLAADTVYLIGASGYNGTDPFGRGTPFTSAAVINAGTDVQIAASSYDAPIGVGDGWASETGGGGRYAAANFQFTVVPEPSTGVAIALSALVVASRRRRAE